MNKKLKFFVVDDDQDFINLMIKLLEPEAQTVFYNTSIVSVLPSLSGRARIWLRPMLA